MSFLSGGQLSTDKLVLQSVYIFTVWAGIKINSSQNRNGIKINSVKVQFVEFTLFCALLLSEALVIYIIWCK